MAASFADVDVGMLTAVVARLWPVLALQPPLRHAFGFAWPVGTGVLAVLLGSLARGSHVLVEPSLPNLVSELFIGTTVGLLLSITSSALVGAGRQTAKVLGISAVPAMELLFCLLGWSALWATGRHEDLLWGVREWCELWPPGCGLPWAGTFPEIDVSTVARTLHALTVLVLGLAAPGLLAGVFAEICTRAIELRDVRLATALPILMRTGATLIALQASATARAADWARAFG